MTNLFVASALLSILLSGCASRPPAPKSKYVSVDPVLGQTLQDRGTHLLAKPTPSFSRITQGDQAKLSTAMMFGAIGGGIGAGIVFSQAKSAGQAIVTENGISDPTLRMAEHVREMLATRYGSTTTDSGFVVTVSTDNWSLAMNDLVFSASIVIENAANDAAKPAKPLAKGAPAATARHPTAPQPKPYSRTEQHNSRRNSILRWNTACRNSARNSSCSSSLRRELSSPLSRPD